MYLLTGCVKKEKRRAMLQEFNPLNTRTIETHRIFLHCLNTQDFTSGKTLKGKEPNRENNRKRKEPKEKETERERTRIPAIPNPATTNYPSP